MNSRVLIFSGLSGSGKTCCMQLLMELDYTIIYNLNKDSINMFLDQDKYTNKLAIFIGIESEFGFNDKYKVIKELKIKLNAEQIFLKASMDEIINRYQENRKTHPYLNKDENAIDIQQAYLKELDIFYEYKKDADFVLDTTNKSEDETKNILRSYLGEIKEFEIYINSFGFKYGNLKNNDFIFDVRYLSNPFYKKDLRYKTGLDSEVSEYVFSSKVAQENYEHMYKIIKNSIPEYIKVNKMILMIGVGCTGGQHRSVAFAKKLEEDLKKEFYVKVAHLGKENWKC